MGDGNERRTENYGEREKEKSLEFEGFRVGTLNTHMHTHV